ncbi:integrin alpha-8 [Ciona intestinalis]
MDFSVNDYYLNADSNNAPLGRSKKTILVSQPISTKQGLVQCLRFCFNAFSIKEARRKLHVWMEYEDGRKHDLYKFNGPKQYAGEYWNHTELEIKGSRTGFYKLFFKATVYKSASKRTCVPMSRRPRKDCPDHCNALGDVVLADINVSNLPCDEENMDVDVVENEQSIGLNLAARQASDNVMSLTTCAPLWQHNCGYAREANGACYEVEANVTHVRAIHKHNPISQECIRGKIDIVLVVDQSGSVNQCNFQKVKRWLRDIVRSFNLGVTEQDVGVVVYSKKATTSTVVDLGFSDYNSDGHTKKQEMTKILKKLAYEGGQTYTGYAFKLANEMLTGNKSRPDAKKMIILLTDGATTAANTLQLKDELEVSRAGNVMILAVGVGKFNQTELIQIAGDRKNFFAVTKFSELEKVRDKLRSSVSVGNLEGSLKNESTDDLQQCQLGFSIHYDKDGLHMGSPGCYGGAGNVITHHLDITPSYKNLSANSNFTQLLEHQESTHHNLTGKSPHTIHAQSVLFGEYDVPTLGQIQTALTSNLADSYLGYAVTSGTYFGPSSGIYVASSAPRFHNNGTVLIYRSLLDSPSRGRHYVLGQQFTEYFGAALCTEDINADGYDDLIVGAPLHNSHHPDVGRAYVYLGGNTMNRNPDFVLRGSEHAFSRFGSAISAVGDLNLDGFPDIVVSATHEMEGVIYIYHGCNTGLFTTPAQIIRPTTLSPAPSVIPGMFGMSVTGKIDIDDNGYYDLLVGSPSSDNIVILLTRPVVDVTTTIMTSQQIDPRQSCTVGSHVAAYGCFDCELCFSYNGASIQSDIFVNYHLVADAGKEYQRFLFSTNNLEYIESTTSVSQHPDTSCITYNLYLKPSARDLMNPADLSVHYDLITHHDVTSHTPDDHTHHSVQSNSTNNNSNVSDDSWVYPTASIYSGDYPLNEQSNISMSNTSHTRNKREEPKPLLDPVLNMYISQDVSKFVPIKTFCKKTKCVTDLTLNAHLADKNGNPTSKIEIKYRTAARLRIKLRNTGPEDAHDVTTKVTFPKQLVFMSFQSVNKLQDDSTPPCFQLKETKTAISNVAEYKTVAFNVRNPVFSTDKACEVDALFDLTSQLDPYTNDKLHFIVEASTISNDTESMNNVKGVDAMLEYIGGLKLTGYSQPYTVYAETNDSYFPKDTFEMLRTNDPHSVKHQFMVRNTKFFGFKKLMLNIKWPAYLFMNASRFMAMYITNITCISSPHTTCWCDSSNFTDIFGIYRQPHPPQLPNEAMMIPEGDILYQQLPCHNNDCYITIPCHVTNLEPFANSSVTIHSIAYPNTMSMLKTSLNVESSASVEIIGKNYIVLDRRGIGFTQINVANDITPAITFAGLTDDTDIFELPLWVYIASAGGGLVLLLLLMLALWKLGFFKSKYADKKRAAEEEQDWGEAAAPLKA